VLEWTNTSSQDLAPVDAPCAKDYAPRVRQRALFLVGTFWVGAALIGHAKERRGAITCECQDDCWCDKPDVDLFRWVLPIRQARLIRHRSLA